MTQTNVKAAKNSDYW